MAERTGLYYPTKDEFNYSTTEEVCAGAWIDPIFFNYLGPGEYSFEVPANAVQGSTFHVLMRPPGVAIAFDAYTLGIYDTVVE